MTYDLVERLRCSACSVAEIVEGLLVVEICDGQREEGVKIVSKGTCFVAGTSYDLPPVFFVNSSSHPTITPNQRSRR